MNKKINKLVKIKKNPSLALRTFFKKILRLIPFSRNYSRAFSEILSKKLLHDNKIRDVRPSLIYSLEESEISDDLVLIATEAIKRAAATTPTGDNPANIATTMPVYPNPGDKSAVR